MRGEFAAPDRWFSRGVAAHAVRVDLTPALLPATLRRVALLACIVARHQSQPQCDESCALRFRLELYHVERTLTSRRRRCCELLLLMLLLQHERVPR